MSAIETTRNFTGDDIDLMEAMAIKEARESFWAYRQWISPSLKLVGHWFPRDVARQLQQFKLDLDAGRRPILVIEAPPQHGKSISIYDFLSWMCGHNPDLPVIYTSFSERLVTRANLRMQRTLDSEKYHKTFPETRINSANVVTISNQYQRNRDILEFVGREGSFRNTTVKGPITGEGLGLGVIDDPIKGRAEANSLTNRDAVWDWLLDDFFTRFSEKAGLLIILTRWHIDDPVGRLEQEFPNVKRVRYPALAEHDEWLVDGKRVVSDNPPVGGTLLRRKGEPLFPEHKSLEFLMMRRRVMTVSSWEAIYQQNPVVMGGETFPIERFNVMPYLPARAKVTKRVRYWDKAGTSGGGKYSAGVLMAALDDGRFVVEDVIRERLNAFDREKRIKQTVEDDGEDVTTWVEQEPGSGGKESAERTIANNAGAVVYADRVTGDKETRAEPYAAQVQGGNVILLNAPWVKAFKEEHEFFPNGPFKDQVDAAAGAFAKLVAQEKKKAGLLW